MTYLLAPAIRAWRAITGALLMLALVLTIAVPVMAETTGQRSTRNILLGAAAATVGIILYNNYQHKKAAANTVVGYTRDGGVIYADGRIVYPNGAVLYPSNNGQTVCDWDNDGDHPRCGNNAVAYAPRGHAYGYWKNKKHGKGDNNEENDH